MSPVDVFRDVLDRVITSDDRVRSLTLSAERRLTFRVTENPRQTSSYHLSAAWRIGDLDVVSEGRGPTLSRCLRTALGDDVAEVALSGDLSSRWDDEVLEEPHEASAIWDGFPDARVETIDAVTVHLGAVWESWAMRRERRALHDASVLGGAVVHWDPARDEPVHALVEALADLRASARRASPTRAPLSAHLTRTDVIVIEPSAWLSLMQLYAHAGVRGFGGPRRESSGPRIWDSAGDRDPMQGWADSYGEIAMPVPLTDFKPSDALEPRAGRAKGRFTKSGWHVAPRLLPVSITVEPTEALDIAHESWQLVSAAAPVGEMLRVGTRAHWEVVLQSPPDLPPTSVVARVEMDLSELEGSILAAEPWVFHAGVTPSVALQRVCVSAKVFIDSEVLPASETGAFASTSPDLR